MANKVNARSTGTEDHAIKTAGKAAALGAAAKAGTKAIKASQAAGKLTGAEATAKTAQTILRVLGIIL